MLIVGSAEIIPIEADAGNAAVAIKRHCTYIIWYIFYIVAPLYLYLGAYVLYSRIDRRWFR